MPLQLRNLGMVGLPLLLGMVAVYLLLPRPRPVARWLGVVAGAAALLLVGWLWIHVGSVSVETFLFYAFSAIAISAGVLLITQHNPARAALSFALVVLSTCGLFLLQAAPFLMAATIIIYAGAIIVTFLFVIMLAQQEGMSSADLRAREPELATLAGFVLLGALIFVLRLNYDTRGLDQSLTTLRQASEQQTAPAIKETLADGYRQVAARSRLREEDSQRLSDDLKFFFALRQQVQQVRGSPDRDALDRELELIEFDWKEAEEAAAMQTKLRSLLRATEQVRAAAGSLRGGGDAPEPRGQPGETVAPLGRTLFTDYLVAVELGGTLLLVATIGAIAIAGRRTEGLR